jgi:hypothetical protein
MFFCRTLICSFRRPYFRNPFQLIFALFSFTNFQQTCGEKNRTWEGPAVRDPPPPLPDPHHSASSLRVYCSDCLYICSRAILQYANHSHRKLTDFLPLSRTEHQERWNVNFAASVKRFVAPSNKCLTGRFIESVLSQRSTFDRFIASQICLSCLSALK